MPISNHSVRQNQQNDQTNSHATKPTPAKQNVPTAAPSNLQNNGHRGPASGSGNGYRAHDESQMVKSFVFYHFTSSKVPIIPIKNLFSYQLR